MKKKSAKKKTKKKAEKKVHSNESLKDLVVVGIGASAGGLEALRSVFSEFTSSSSASYIVVQHVSPKSKSMLVELLGRETNLEVKEAKDQEFLEANKIYVTPPNVDIIVHNGRIELADLENRAGPKPSIDRLFTSLANEFKDNVVGCVLSGTGTDGAQGIKAIKEAGGVTIAQNPQSAKYDGMPLAAINTGVVDLILTAEEIGSELEVVSNRLYRDQTGERETFPDKPYDAILKLLYKHSNVRFNYYKPKTLNRRINRRMTACKTESIDEYFEYLQNNKNEISRLYQDLLISVTSFFRDGREFEQLQESFRKYLQNKSPLGDSVRIWSAGCASGEETYSLAILLLEILEDMDIEPKDIKIQIFATDINERAMAAARKGFYSSAAMDCIDSNLLRKYFQPNDGGYQIKKHVRDLVVFAKHDLTNGPPFLKIDLISCRNVFIYFEQAAQDKILKMFHYALNPGGLLFLGKSETTGKLKSFFTTRDSNSRIFERSNRTPDPGASILQYKGKNEGRAIESRKFLADKTQDKELLQNQIFKCFYENSIVLDEDFKVVSIFGNAGRYLLWPEGKLEQSFSHLVRPDLKNRLSTLVYSSKRTKNGVKSQLFNFEVDDEKEKIEARVHHFDAFDESLYVIGFVHKPTAIVIENDGSKPDIQLSELESELNSTREHLQAVIEEQETSNEELQALNEEMQSSNEELQSTNEELETSNEELQSTNEELTTLNQELNVRTSELSELTSNLQTILKCVKSPVFVVDSNFNLTRCNPSAVQLFRLDKNCLNKNFRLIESDNDLSRLFNSIESCLKSGSGKTETFDTENLNFQLFCEPIIGHNDKVNGVVATLVDNTKLAHSFRQSESVKRSLYEILEGIPAKVSVKNAEGRYTFVNQTFCRVVKVERNNILGKLDRDIFGETSGESRRKRDFDCLKEGKPTYADEIHVSEDGDEKIFYTVRVPIANELGDYSSICSVGIDISGRAIIEKSLKDFQNAIGAADDCFVMLNEDEDKISVSFCSETLSSLCGLQRQNLNGKELKDLLQALGPNLSAAQIEHYVKLIHTEKKYGCRVEIIRHGKTAFYDFRWNRIHLGNQVKIFLTLIDMTKEQNREISLKKQEEDFSQAGKLAALGEMAAGIAHELKTPLNTIQGYIDLINGLRVNLNGFSPQITDAIENIESTVTTISDIIAGLKSIAKTGDNGHYTICKLSDVLDDVFKISSFHVKNKGIELTYDIPQDIELELNATQLKQVIINLLNNSVDAIRDLSEKWIDVKVELTQDSVKIQIVDSGLGIPKSVAKRLMTPFFTTKKSGTGLGLSLSKNIVAAHNGTLEVDENHPNTCFILTLPLQQNGGSEKEGH